MRINGLKHFFYFQSMGSSLTFRGTVDEASEVMKNHRCSNPICDTNLWRVKHELDMARIKMESLESELYAKGIFILLFYYSNI